MATGAGPGVSRMSGAVEEAARGSGEPAWSINARLAALAAYERLPMPHPDEESWRRTSLKGLDIDRFARPAAPSGGAVGLDDASRELFAESGEPAAQYFEVDGQPAWSAAPAAWPKGVVVSTLADALRDHPDLVQPHLGNIIRGDENRFTAMNAAFWSGGLFVLVPKNTEVELPIHQLVRQSAGGAVFPRTLIVAGANSRVTVIEEYAPASDTAEGFCNGTVEISLGDGANVRYINLQRWNEKSWHFSTKRCWLGKDARMDWLVVTLGSKLCKVWVESELKGHGSTAMMNALQFADGAQHFDHETLQDHELGNSVSDLLFKTALKGHATTVYSGLIRIEHDSQKSDAYQANRNLLLSKDAKADSIPKLEIAANDVRCTHGATVGPVDPEQLFYLQARGIGLDDAQQLLIAGFFEPVFERMPLSEGLRGKLDRAIAGKIVS